MFNYDEFNFFEEEYHISNCSITLENIFEFEMYSGNFNSIKPEQTAFIYGTSYIIKEEFYQIDAKFEDFLRFVEKQKYYLSQSELKIVNVLEGFVKHSVHIDDINEFNDNERIILTNCFDILNSDFNVVHHANYEVIKIAKEYLEEIRTNQNFEDFER